MPLYRGLRSGSPDTTATAEYSDTGSRHMGQLPLVGARPTLSVLSKQPVQKLWLHGVRQRSAWPNSLKQIGHSSLKQIGHSSCNEPSIAAMVAPGPSQN
jgi:hypothetical protein